MFPITTSSDVLDSLESIVEGIIAATIIAHADVRVVSHLAVAAMDAIEADGAAIGVLLKTKGRLAEAVLEHDWIGRRALEEARRVVQLLRRSTRCGSSPFHGHRETGGTFTCFGSQSLRRFGRGDCWTVVERFRARHVVYSLMHSRRRAEYRRIMGPEPRKHRVSTRKGGLGRASRRGVRADVLLCHYWACIRRGIRSRQKIVDGAEPELVSLFRRGGNLHFPVGCLDNKAMRRQAGGGDISIVNRPDAFDENTLGSGLVSAMGARVRSAPVQGLGIRVDPEEPPVAFLAEPARESFGRILEQEFADHGLGDGVDGIGIGGCRGGETGGRSWDMVVPGITGVVRPIRVERLASRPVAELLSRPARRGKVAELHLAQIAESFRVV